MIAAGHPPAAVWGYTPRELSGWLQFVGRRMKREAAAQIGLQAMAGRSEPSVIKKKIKELERE